MNPAIPDKLFFKIGEVAEITGVEQHVLRYWEEEFDILNPEKNRSGQRLYQRKDVELLIDIKRLLYNEQYTIAGAKKKLRERKKETVQMAISFDPAEMVKFKKKLKNDLESILKILNK